jgi:hypothetical protein
MDRDLALQVRLLRDVLDVRDLFGDLIHARRLRERDVGERVSGRRHEHVDVLLPPRVAVVVDANAGLLVRVLGRLRHGHDHLGVLLFLALLRAVFAVHRDVEDAFQLLLEVHRLLDELLAAGEVLTGVDDREGLLPGKQGVVRMDACAHGHSFGSAAVGARLAALRLYHVLRTALQRTPRRPTSRAFDTLAQLAQGSAH